MAKQKSRKSRMSMGGATKLRKAKAEARAAKFARRAEAGKKYQYKPIEAKKGTEEYAQELNARAQKNRLNPNRWVSAMRKLDNFLEKQAIEQKEWKEKKATAKAKKNSPSA